MFLLDSSVPWPARHVDALNNRPKEAQRIAALREHVARIGTEHAGNLHFFLESYLFL